MSIGSILSLEQVPGFKCCAELSLSRNVISDLIAALMLRIQFLYGFVSSNTFAVAESPDVAGVDRLVVDKLPAVMTFVSS